MHKPTETENTKNEGREEVQSDLLHDFPEILLMKVALWSHGETLRLRIQSFPVLLMNYQWSREQKWNLVRVITLSTLTSRQTQYAISA